MKAEEQFSKVSYLTPQNQIQIKWVWNPGVMLKRQQFCSVILSFLYKPTSSVLFDLQEFVQTPPDICAMKRI